MQTLKNLDHFDTKEKASERARKMLADTRAVRDFGYHGSLDLAGHTRGAGLWGFAPFAVHRDSDALARSNWEVISSSSNGRLRMARSRWRGWPRWNGRIVWMIIRWPMRITSQSLNWMNTMKRWKSQSTPKLIGSIWRKASRTAGSKMS